LKKSKIGALHGGVDLSAGCARRLRVALKKEKVNRRAQESASRCGPAAALDRKLARTRGHACPALPRHAALEMTKNRAEVFTRTVYVCLAHSPNPGRMPFHSLPE
jgi:hypothetical protein